MTPPGLEENQGWTHRFCGARRLWTIGLAGTVFGWRSFTAQPGVPPPWLRRTTQQIHRRGTARFPFVFLRIF